MSEHKDNAKGPPGFSRRTVELLERMAEGDELKSQAAGAVANRLNAADERLREWCQAGDRYEFIPIEAPDLHLVFDKILACKVELAAHELEAEDLKVAIEAGIDEIQKRACIRKGIDINDDCTVSISYRCLAIHRPKQGDADIASDEERELHGDLARLISELTLTRKDDEAVIGDWFEERGKQLLAICGVNDRLLSDLAEFIQLTEESGRWITGRVLQDASYANRTIEVANEHPEAVPAPIKYLAYLTIRCVKSRSREDRQHESSRKLAAKDTQAIH